MNEFPGLEVKSVRAVFNDGAHNAFTDLCRYRDRFYLTFRSCPDGHGVSPTSSIVVMSSADAATWRTVFTFSAPDRDVRDPHFLEFRGKLFVYTGAWLCDPYQPERREKNDHLGFAAWTEDGDTWRGPKALEGVYGHYIWRAATYADKAFLCGRRLRDFVPVEPGVTPSELIQSALLESDDGLVWRFVGLFQETLGDETAFLFEDDGAILAVARTHGGGPAQLCRARPPYTAWTRVDLDRFIGGPMLTKWGERYLVGGRKLREDAGPVTALYWLADDRLREIAELPSGGDNSYPGFVALDDTRGLLSFYSSHEGSGSTKPPSAIYLADLELTP